MGKVNETRFPSWIAPTACIDRLACQVNYPLQRGRSHAPGTGIRTQIGM